MNSSEVEKLCMNVINQAKGLTSNENDSSLATLRRACGKNVCGCVSVTPRHRLSQLLRAGLGDALTDYSVGLSVVGNYGGLAHEAHCRAALQQLLRHSIDDTPSESRNFFMEQVWESSALRNFPVHLLEEFLLLKQINLEQDIFTAFEKVLKKCESSENVWNNARLERIVFWSGNSAKIFSVVTSVLNSLLRRVVEVTKHYEPCVSIVQQFVNSVKTRCAESKRDFVMLYPCELHSLVSLLDISPELYPRVPANPASVTVSTVVRLVDELLKTKPAQTVCLMTHFPEWAPFSVATEKY